MFFGRGVLCKALSCYRDVVFRRVSTAPPTSKPIALVSGKTTGIGFAVSDRLLLKGYRVCMADIDERQGKASLAEHRKSYSENEVMFRKCNVESFPDLEETFSAVQKLGRIDVLVNITEVTDFLMLRVESPKHGCKLALKYMATTPPAGVSPVVINLLPLCVFLDDPEDQLNKMSKLGLLIAMQIYGNENTFRKYGVVFTALWPLYYDVPRLLPDSLGQQKQPQGKVYIKTNIVADAVSLIIEDRINGSALLVLDEKIEYDDPDSW